MDLQLADTPLYITVAIFVAIAAIVSADIRNPESLLPKPGVNRMALLLLVGVFICVSQINVLMLFRNNYEQMSKLAVFNYITHSTVLVILFLLTCLWYRLIAIHKETPAGMPTNPKNLDDEQSS